MQGQHFALIHAGFPVEWNVMQVWKKVCLVPRHNN